MYNNDPKRVATGEVRLSYAHLNEPYANPQNPGQKPRYSVTMLIPKTDTATKQGITDAMNASYEYGVENKWKGARPSMKSPLIYDGDGVRPNGQPFGPECKGCWVITASTGRKPHVCDINNPNTELLPQDVYSGMYARVTMSFYNPAQGNPVACSLDNVFKTRDGEPLSGGPSAMQDYAGLGVTPTPTGQTAMYANAQGATPVYPVGTINPLTGLPM
ncbi:MAG: DUF2815 family protein [Clostridiales bacterium]|nr:DUF2815 family protein [Clostridiales bacterium]